MISPAADGATVKRCRRWAATRTSQHAAEMSSTTSATWAGAWCSPDRTDQASPRPARPNGMAKEVHGDLRRGHALILESPALGGIGREFAVDLG